MTSAKILIAEDEKALSKALAEKLGHENYLVTTVANGEEALFAVKKNKFDIILLDLVMPKVSGFEVLEELKGDPELCSVPVIVLSNLGEDENIKRALQMGAVDFFIKANQPIATMLEKIKEQLVK